MQESSENSENSMDVDDGETKQSSSSDSDSDEENDEEGKLIALYISTLKSIDENKYEYNNFISLVDIAHKLTDLDKIRQSCELFSSVYPLAPEIWLKWIRVEMSVSTTDNEYRHIQTLFKRALNDYYSTEVALEYSKLAILWNNDEIWDEIIPRYTQSCLEGGQLFEQWRTYFECKKSEIEKSTYLSKLIENYKIELKLPLFDIEKVYVDFKVFVELHKEEIDADLVDWETIDRRYNRAKSALGKILAFELKLKNANAKMYNEKEKLYLEYIDECEEFLEDDFLQTLYERLTTDCCLSYNAWLEYIKFLDSLSYEETEKNSIFNFSKLNIIDRGLRNITWNSDLYIAKMRIIESMENHEKGLYREAFETAIAAEYNSPEHLVQIWFEYLTYLRRNTDFNNEKQIEILRKNFELSWQSLSRFWGVLADQNCELIQFWGRIEYCLLKSTNKGRELWNTVMSSSDNSTKSILWIEFANLELLKNVESARKIFMKGIASNGLDSFDNMKLAWLSFERMHGNADSLVLCEKTCRKFQSKYITKSLKNDGKYKKIIHSSGESKKRTYPDRGIASEKNEGTNKKLKTDEHFEVDPSKDHLTVFISNLDYKITEDQVSTIFENLSIQKISLVKDEKNDRGRGFGYVEFETENDVKTALGLDRKMLNGRPTFISSCLRDKSVRDKVFKFSQDIEPEKLFVKGIPYTSTKEDLEDMFKKYGELKDIRIVCHKNGKSKGIAYVEYKSNQSASKAVLDSDKKEYNGHVLSVAISAPPPRSNKQDVPFKRPNKPLGIREEMKPRISFIPQSVQKKILSNQPDKLLTENSNLEKKSNDYFRNLVLNTKK